MGKVFEVPKDSLAVGLCTALDVQFDSLKFHLNILVFLSGEIYSIRSKEKIVSGMFVLRLEFDLDKSGEGKLEY
jgi:hypothetical protein